MTYVVVLLCLGAGGGVADGAGEGAADGGGDSAGVAVADGAGLTDGSATGTSETLRVPALPAEAVAENAGLRVRIAERTPTVMVRAHTTRPPL
jgi:hypothetical protein